MNKALPTNAKKNHTLLIQLITIYCTVYLYMQLIMEGLWGREWVHRKFYTAMKTSFMYSQKLCRLSPNFHIHVSMSDLYIFPGSVHLFSSSRIGRPIVGIINR